MPIPPRILLVSRNFPPLIGGMERLNQHLLSELEQHYETRLVGPRGATEHVCHPERVRTCPALPIAAFLGCAAIQGILTGRRNPLDLVIAGSGVNAPPAWLTARASGAPWVVYLHGLDILANHMVYQNAVLPIIRRADAWLVNSHATERLAIAAGLDARRIHIVHPGVEVPEALAAPKQIRDWLEAKDLGDRPLVLSVGRLTRRKGLLEFVTQALPQLLTAHPQALLVVVGEEPHGALPTASLGVSALQSAARANGTADNLRFLGHLSDPELALAYQAASALIFPVIEVPGDIEGFGMVAIEAAAHGLPTVAFAVGGVPDAVQEGISGHLIPPGDYATMTSRLIALLSRGRAATDTAACQGFATRFAWHQFGSQLRWICETIIDSSRITPTTHAS